jgi:integrase/recombinase XerD
MDGIWMERGLSANTLGAYRADLMTLWRGLAEKNIPIEKAEKADLLDFIAQRVESGAKPRSTARQLSSFRRFFRYIMREGLRDTDPTADIEMPRIGRSLPKSLTGPIRMNRWDIATVPCSSFCTRPAYEYRS